MNSLPAGPTPTFRSLPFVARSPWVMGITFGFAVVAVDVVGDGLVEMYSAAEPGNLFNLLADEIFSPSMREIWVRALLFMSGFVSALAVSRIHAKNHARYVHLASHDRLTDLPNRDSFLKCVQNEAAYARRNHCSVAVFLIGLDHFKLANDLLGHPGGDQILIAMAQRLRIACVGATCTARLCSDHFAVLARITEPTTQAHAIARDIQRAISSPLSVDDKDIFLTASIGATIFPDDGMETEKLLLRADHALGRAKASGRGGVCFYTKELEQHAAYRVQIESGLRKALEHGEFVLHYQPIVNPNTGEIRTMEALIRWKRGDGTMVPPLDFIPAAENAGLIVPIGEWVLRQACADMRRWHDAGHTKVVVAVNVSNQQFRHRDFVSNVQRIVRESRLPPTCLELEITESMFAHDIESTLDTLNRLRDFGIQLAIDDFGTGYSSMSYLGRLPVDRLKIDRSFVNDLTPRSGNEAIIKAVIALATELRIGVIAEGVETREQLEFLRSQGCNAIQGYLFSRPVAFETGSRLLTTGLFDDDLAKTG